MCLASSILGLNAGAISVLNQLFSIQAACIAISPELPYIRLSVVGGHE